MDNPLPPLSPLKKKLYFAASRSFVWQLLNKYLQVQQNTNYTTNESDMVVIFVKSGSHLDLLI